MEMIKDPKEPDYWSGFWNHAIRYYFYVNTGLNVFNNFKYLVAAIFGIYILLHLKNGMWLLIMSGISIPILGVIGYYSVHYINRVQDYLNVKYGTHYSLLNITLLQEILNELKKRP